MLAKAKITKGGKVSIPSVCRKYLKLQDGEELIFNIVDNKIVVCSTDTALADARKLLDKYHPGDKSLVSELIENRRAEFKNE